MYNTVCRVLPYSVCRVPYLTVIGHCTPLTPILTHVTLQQRYYTHDNNNKKKKNANNNRTVSKKNKEGKFIEIINKKDVEINKKDAEIEQLRKENELLKGGQKHSEEPIVKPTVNPLGLAAESTQFNIKKNEQYLRFYGDNPITFLPKDMSMFIPNKEHAHKSPLASELFTIPGIYAVFIAHEDITLTIKSSPTKTEEDINDIRSKARKFILSFLSSGRKDILTEEAFLEMREIAKELDPSPSDRPWTVIVKEAIHKSIRPYGGKVRLVKVKCNWDNCRLRVYVKLEGAARSDRFWSVIVENLRYEVFKGKDYRVASFFDVIDVETCKEGEMDDGDDV